MKRHKIKMEHRDSDPYKDRDLAHYLHDRVALLRQAMSLIKPRELKAMTPSGLRGIPDRHLQELCLEELLGISSKRLCAVLDGAEPPTDTDSSSQSGTEGLETISLDSISSDEAALSPVVEKAKKKHKQHKRKTKQKSSHQEDKQSKEHQESIAGRAGMTVLELLELQARARAIRAQLAADGARGKKTGAEVEPVDDSADDDDVQIKEEEPEVVELSSDEDKPDVKELEAAVRQHSNKEQEGTKTVVKTSNNLTVIVPQKQTRKIKLNRNKVAPSTTLTQINKTIEATKSKQDKSVTKTTVTVPEKVPKTTKKVKQKAKKKRGVVNDKTKDGSDHDEITLQLSDSEKMDLLEEFDKRSGEASSSDEEDSEEDSSDSDSSSRNTQLDNIPIETTKMNHNVVSKKHEGSEVSDASVDVTEVNGDTKPHSVIEDQTLEECRIVATENNTSSEHTVEKESSTAVVVNEEDHDKSVEENHGSCIEQSSNPVIEVACIDDIPIQPSDDIEVDNTSASLIENHTSYLTASNESRADPINDNNDQISCQKSDGEVSDRSSSEVESSVMQPEVVCISDEDTDKTGKKKSKKKDKKSKKEKKTKRKKSDFREASDQNFYKDIDNVVSAESHHLTDSFNIKTENTVNTVLKKFNIIEIDIDSDNVYEVLEISDDSSCYEVEGISFLSNEPTSEEIEALSVKIDHEIDREVVVTDEQITEHDNDILSADKRLGTDEDTVANISWKDRYLRSTKVKRVLTTANILNALRKKNKELKKKLEESKKILPEVVETPAELEKDIEEKNVEVGSIEHFNTLQGSTKYVDPVKEVIPEKEKDLGVQMKKDAKKLLKMYKRLLKYNDMEKKKDPNKPKKKKNKKHKKSKNGDAANITVTTL